MTDTYEFERDGGKLEKYEWDDVWFECADSSEKKRVLFVGDSISRGYRRPVISKLSEKYLADNYATSKAVDNPFFLSMIDLVLSQQEHDIIHFNNGLHGFHLDAGEYGRWYEKAVEYIMNKYPEKKLVLALSTPVRNPQALHEFGERNSDVKARNGEVKRIAEKYGLPLSDLYSHVEKRTELYAPDGVHFTGEGYEVLADAVFRILNKI